MFIKYLKSLGVPEKDILLESEALNTKQSVKRNREFLGEGFKGENSLLVTSAINLPRTLKYYRKVAMDLISFATLVPVLERFYKF
jgi:uncharacterized SAM-binding protein YcdF (DUF218 family)